MIRDFPYVMAGAAILVLSASAADARTHHVARHAHHHHARVGYDARRGARELGDGAQSGAGDGFAPAASSYQGPGADVFRRAIQTEQAPGVTREIDPDAKQSATGGPAGGLPSNGNGP